MTKEEKAWLLAVAYATTAPKDTSPDEFLVEVERSEADFLSLLQKKEAEAAEESIKIWEKLGS
ncbi:MULTISPECIES: hypothetical protein [Edwardsiella]|uniref:Phage protein n=1 Tax=Edwardsiella anguillarum TaxID=1821960 RepID=A0ABY8SG06_9GAMM|nr:MULTISPECIES: hypothetical protein [Edwardsiella]UBU94858.1 hypothetical protein AAZ33_18545 [Edwardsiella sp. LADL05-105]WHP84619.1 hypothetical protein MQ095_03875 [Edwardsiella anguillarum]WHP88402.1 hypothetical protein MQ088_03875 [Edwardsiella anguillarum]WHP92202.1 hypothetical protein MQ091_03875 [Edwardsiella anguillarum]WHP96008.1 hypothetical protein MQ096_03875 [Edwardsiella anguillarum]